MLPPNGMSPFWESPDLLGLCPPHLLGLLELVLFLLKMLGVGGCAAFFSKTEAASFTLSPGVHPSSCSFLEFLLVMGARSSLSTFPFLLLLFLFSKVLLRALRPLGPTPALVIFLGFSCKRKREVF